MISILNILEFEFVDCLIFFLISWLLKRNIFFLFLPHRTTKVWILWDNINQKYSAKLINKYIFLYTQYHLIKNNPHHANTYLVFKLLKFKNFLSLKQHRPDAEPGKFMNYIHCMLILYALSKFYLKSFLRKINAWELLLLFFCIYIAKILNNTKLAILSSTKWNLFCCWK